MQSAKQKIDEGVRLKEEGNKYVQAKEYRKACSCYRRVFAFANGLISKDNQEMAKFTSPGDLLSAEDDQKLKDLKVSTYANLALCYLRLKEPQKSLDCAQKALTIDGSNVKALLRVGSASTELRLWEKAKDALLKALQLESENQTVKSELLVWKSAYGKWLEEQQRKEKELFGGKLL
jgi:tetratricopeptide (TPR) repeat protein